MVRKVPMAELMETLIQEVETLAKEQEAEGGAGESEHQSSNGGSEWTPIGSSTEQRSSLVRDIPVLPNSR